MMNCYYLNLDECEEQKVKKGDRLDLINIHKSKKVYILN